VFFSTLSLRRLKRIVAVDSKSLPAAAAASRREMSPR
jgi:hypothetical protein